MNPAFNSSQWSLSSSQAWIPAQAWLQQQQQQWQVQQQQMQQAANFNPYKRVPRPPSAEYLATKLSDNPLGLSNMVPRYVVLLCGAGPHGGDVLIV
jgi:transcription initiation factor TFIID subunit TAF12